MLIKERPVGIWILAFWSAAHAIPAMFVAIDASGSKAVIAWAVIIGEVALATGLIMGWRLARYFLIAQVTVHVFVFALFAWATLFVAIAWGLHGVELAIVLSTAGYLLLVCWAFMYLFHPGVKEFFTR
jgi:hypothetical protein